MFDAVGIPTMLRLVLDNRSLLQLGTIPNSYVFHKDGMSLREEVAIDYVSSTFGASAMVTNLSLTLRMVVTLVPVMALTFRRDKPFFSSAISVISQLLQR